MSAGLELFGEQAEQVNVGKAEPSSIEETLACKLKFAKMSSKGNFISSFDEWPLRILLEESTRYIPDSCTVLNSRISI